MSTFKYIALIAIILVTSATHILAQEDFEPRVSNGQEAPFLTWTSQVLIIKGENSENICGGSLIASNWVLTAASCVPYGENAVQYKLIIGAHDRHDNEVVRHSAMIVHHPEYSTGNHSFDVALLQLDEYVEFNDRIQPMCLELSPYQEWLLNGKSCRFTGFGGSYPRKEEIFVVQEISMKPFDHDKCVEYYKNYEEVTDNQICMVSVFEPSDADSASNGGACPGDEGGPLQCFVDVHQVWYQSGIAWPNERCESSPTVFNLVYKYADFIKTYTKYVLPDSCLETSSE